MQGVLEESFARLLAERIAVVGAGRTDAGVHATGQVISFRTANDMPIATIERGVNALLPADVAVRELRESEPDFHARYSAVGRTYEYRIWNARRPRPLLRRTTWWVPDGLDVAAIEAATQHLLGAHDFSAFAMKGIGSRVRTVRRARWSSEDSGVLVLDIEADGFLRGMVRGIVGTLVEVGRGKLDADAFAAVTASADRGRGGPSAPPQGLSLVAVTYDDARPATQQRRSDERDEEDE